MVCNVYDFFGKFAVAICESVVNSAAKIFSIAIFHIELKVWVKDTLAGSFCSIFHFIVCRQAKPFLPSHTIHIHTNRNCFTKIYVINPHHSLAISFFVLAHCRVHLFYCFLHLSPTESIKLRICWKINRYALWHSSATGF